MRTMDHRLLEAVANDPEVRPFMASDAEEVRLEKIVTLPGNYAFINDEGGFICLRMDEGLYEAHTIFKPGCNVRDVMRLMHESFEFMFVETECMEIITKVPDNNRGARRLALVGNFREQFERKDAWAPGIDVTCLNLPLDRWADVCSTHLRAEGVAFHARIDEAKKVAGDEVLPRPPDPLKDQYAGLAYMMMRSGNPDKAVRVYNRVSVMAGFPSFRMVWDHPAVIHVGDAVVQIHNKEMEVLLCR